MPKNRILVLDDQQPLRSAICEYLRNCDYETVEASSCTSAIDLLRRVRPDAAVLDYSLPDGNSLIVLEHIKQLDPLIPVIVLTAHGTIELAVEAVKKGADNFLTKPIELNALVVFLERALEAQRARRKQAVKAVQGRRVFDPFIGTSAAIRQLEYQVKKVVNTDTPVLLQGETGTGKTILARWMHEQGHRREEALLDLNCATFSRELLEAELFGFEKGAFTGAIATKQGLFEVAHHGTVFLDEIGDIDSQIQPKLLKVLEDKQLRRIGDVRDRTIDVRLIAATHQDLVALVREKKFRSDLYFRIGTIPITVPPLRERREDIPLLADMFIEQFSKELGRSDLRLAEDGLAALCSYSWPGNIRELRNALERAALLCDGNTLGECHFVFEMRGSGPSEKFPTNMTLLEMEKAFIEAVLREEKGRVPQAAERLAVPKSSLYHKIKEYGLVLQNSAAASE